MLNKKYRKILLRFVILLSFISLIGIITPNHGDPIKANNFEETNGNNESKKINIVNQISSSAVDYTNATKTVLAGSDVDSWDYNIISDDDGISDTTNFTLGSAGIQDCYINGSGTTIFSQFDFGTSIGTGEGSALRSDDDNYLWTSFFQGLFGQYWMKLRWGYYSDFEPNLHQRLTKIIINSEVWIEGGSSGRSRLRLLVYDNDENIEYLTIATSPTNAYHYQNPLYIESGALFDNIKAGGKIDRIEVQMLVDAFWQTTYIYLDYVYITYETEQYDADFYYEIDYGFYNFTEISEFNITVDIDDLVPGLGIHLYNFNTSNWEKFANVSENGIWNEIISENANFYFNTEDKFRIRFERYGYVDLRNFMEYNISIDWIRLDFLPPEIPLNLKLDQGYEHILLYWDVSLDNGIPINHYNVFRGEEEGGDKILIDTSITNEYNDSSAVVGTRYYYVISAENNAGLSQNSTEVDGRAFDSPYIEWKTPYEDDTIIFGQGECIFNLTYDSVQLVDVILNLNGLNISSVWEENSTVINYYNVSIDGYVNATLYGFIEGNPSPYVEDSRNFTFSKITVDVYELIESNTTIIGKKLYLILHDPNGDNSFSSYGESTTVSMGVGAHLLAVEETIVELGVDFNIFGYEIGFSNRLTYRTSTETESDFYYEITDSTELTSNLDSSNKEFIGPGYGDRYWGESWTFKYMLMAHHRTYFNSTTRYEDPKIHYGIVRGGEVVLNDDKAPEIWRNQNPVYNGWQNVLWIDEGVPKIVDGGAPYKSSHGISSTLTESTTVSMYFESYTALTALGMSGSYNVSLETKFTSEHSLSDDYEVSYTIFDEESSDYIVQSVGIDQKFGTFIFKTSEFLCETSSPLEYNTHDYIAPHIQFPEITIDSSGDRISPYSYDSPKINVDISDEGGIQSALIFYSINDGINWDTVLLSVQIANPGTWQGYLPSLPHGTSVLWYISAWDIEGTNTTRKDPDNLAYTYAVINKEPTVSVLSPIAGQTYKESVTINWEGSDLDGDSLSYTLSYNLAGTGWQLIEDELTGNTFIWDINNITSCDQVLIKIVADDGFGGIAEDTMDYVFSIHEIENVGSSASNNIPGYQFLPLIVFGFTGLVIINRKIKKNKK